MKQHITAKQLNELSEKGKEKLYAGHAESQKDSKLKAIPAYHKVFLQKDPEISISYPLLSIGQMIEFLDDSYEGWWHLNIHFRDDGITVWANDWEEKKGGVYQPRPMELVDALWQAVKETLNDN